MLNSCPKLRNVPKHVYQLNTASNFHIFSGKNIYITQKPLEAADNVEYKFKTLYNQLLLSIIMKRQINCLHRMLLRKTHKNCQLDFRIFKNDDNMAVCWCFKGTRLLIFGVICWKFVRYIWIPTRLPMIRILWSKQKNGFYVQKQFTQHLGLVCYVIEIQQRRKIASHLWLSSKCRWAASSAKACSR